MAKPCDLKFHMRYARREYPRLHSLRGASAATVRSNLHRDITLLECIYAFAIGTFRRWWCSSPLCSPIGGWRSFPTALPLFPARECWSSSQRATREQGPTPISSPMRLHRTLLFPSSRLFVSRVQSAILPCSPRADGFRAMIIGLPQGRDEEE